MHARQRRPPKRMRGISPARTRVTESQAESHARVQRREHDQRIVSYWETTTDDHKPEEPSPERALLLEHHLRESWSSRSAVSRSLACIEPNNSSAGGRSSSTPAVTNRLAYSSSGARGA